MNRGRSREVSRRSGQAQFRALWERWRGRRKADLEAFLCDRAVDSAEDRALADPLAHPVAPEAAADEKGNGGAQRAPDGDDRDPPPETEEESGPEREDRAGKKRTAVGSHARPRIAAATGLGRSPTRRAPASRSAQEGGPQRIKAIAAPVRKCGAEGGPNSHRARHHVAGGTAISCCLRRPALVVNSNWLISSPDREAQGRRHRAGHVRVGVGGDEPPQLDRCGGPVLRPLAWAAASTAASCSSVRSSPIAGNPSCRRSGGRTTDWPGRRQKLRPSWSAIHCMKAMC